MSGIIGRERVLWLVRSLDGQFRDPDVVDVPKVNLCRTALSVELKSRKEPDSVLSVGAD